MRSGRSLDQLYRSSMDADEDRANSTHDFNLHSSRGSTDELRIQLEEFEQQRQSIIEDCNK